MKTLLFSQHIALCLTSYELIIFKYKFTFFCRAEKTEVLSEDLVHLEKKVENIKQAFQSTTKKIASTLPGSGTDVDKRLVSDHFC